MTSLLHSNQPTSTHEFQQYLVSNRSFIQYFVMNVECVCVHQRLVPFLLNLQTRQLQTKFPFYTRENETSTQIETKSFSLCVTATAGDDSFRTTAPAFTWNVKFVNGVPS